MSKQRRRILLIDDEDDIREVVQLSLEMTAAWEVLAASSGKEGVAKAESEKPDAILLDVMMPELDGPATLKLLKANPAIRGIPVVLLTAKVHSAERSRFSELGAAAVMTKPFDPLKLASEIAEALGWAPL